MKQHSPPPSAVTGWVNHSALYIHDPKEFSVSWDAMMHWFLISARLADVIVEFRIRRGGLELEVYSVRRDWVGIFAARLRSRPPVLRIWTRFGPRVILEMGGS